MVGYRRDIPVMHVLIEDIPIPSIEPDPMFTQLYLESVLGAELWLTRLSRSAITRGFISKGGSLRRDEVEPEKVNLIADSIRSGSRMPLYVYQNQKAGILCPDDELVLLAYEKLEIETVPVVLLSPKSEVLEFAALKARYYQTPTGFCTVLKGIESFFPTSIGSMFGEKEVSLQELISIHNAVLKSLKEKLTDFHKEVEDQVHYHETLYAALVRTLGGLRAIEVLAENSCWLEARIVLRSLYEITLSFHLDWLAPETMGFLLRMNSTVSRKVYREVRRELYAELKESGMPANELKKFVADDLKGFDIASKVYHRAQANPLGNLHSEIYPYLSKFVHQDYSVVAEIAAGMKKEKQSTVEFDEDFLRFLDVICTQIESCVSADIGI